MDHTATFALRLCNFICTALHLRVIEKAICAQLRGYGLHMDECNCIITCCAGIPSGLTNAVSFKAVLSDEGITLGSLQVGFYHLVDELIEACAWTPAQFAPRFA
jgi:hypothetical protein